MSTRSDPDETSSPNERDHAVGSGAAESEAAESHAAAARADATSRAETAKVGARRQAEPALSEASASTPAVGDAESDVSDANTPATDGNNESVNDDASASADRTEAATWAEPRDGSPPPPDNAKPSPSGVAPSFGSVLPDLAVAAILFVGIGASVGSGIHSLLHFDELPALVEKNTMSAEARRAMLGYMGLGAAVPLLFAVGYAAWKRSSTSIVQLAALARLFAPLLLTFALPVLFNWRAFAKADLLLVLCATFFGLGLERLLRLTFREVRALRERKTARRGAEHQPRASTPGQALARFRTRWAPRLPFALTIAVATFTAGYFAYYTVLNHYRLQTSSWDLAIFDNMMWNLLRGEWFKASPDLGREGSHIQYHATFVAYVLLPLYAIRQQADTLLVIQALLVGGGAIPLYLLAKAKTNSGWLSALLAFAYCFHGPQHGPTFYDFHFLTISPFFVWWVLYFFETGRKGWLIVAWIVALSVREDVSACLALAGFFLLVSRVRPWWAFWGGVLSAVYFVVVKFGIMPLHRDAADKETFAWIFGDLVAEGSKGYGGILKTLVTNPAFAFNAVLEPEKLAYVLRMFGPVLLLPLRNARTWILLLPAALFTLLSSGYKPLYQTYFQYTSNWTPYLFYGTAVVLNKLAKGDEGWVRLRAAGSALFVTVVLFSYHHGAILGRDNFRGGFRRVQFEYRDVDRERYADLKSLIALIPKNASVTATETEAPHVSNREDCFTMRFGHYDADYLLVSIHEIKRGRSRTYFSRAIATHQYGMLKQAGRFQLWQRGGPKELNDQALKQLGPDPSKTKKARRPVKPSGK